MGQAMDKVRDYIALIMTVAVLLMVGLKISVPDRIWDIYMMVIAFFFGSKQSTDIKGDSDVKIQTTTMPSGNVVTSASTGTSTDNK